MKMHVLLFLLLLSGTVEAGEIDITHLRKMECNGKILLSCDEGYLQCRGELIENNPCYQRMRETMQAMNSYRPVVDRYGNIVTFESFGRVKSDAIFAIKQWDAVMKDCVQGGIK